MVDSWYFQDRVVPEGMMSQVARQLEVGNHKRRTLNTQLSSGTSEGTFAVSAGPYVITVPKQERKANLNVFDISSRKGLENGFTFQT